MSINSSILGILNTCEISQISDQVEELVVWNVEGDKASLAWLMLFVLAPTYPPLLACSLRAPGWVFPSRLAGDQNLLGSYVDIVLKHWVLVWSSEQIVHSHRRLFGEGFEKGCTQANTPFKDLQDYVHALRFYLEYSLPEPLHKLPQQFILLHFYVLQGTDVLFMLCWAQILFHKGLQ